MDFEILKGKVLKEIIGGIGDEEMWFITDTGETYKLFHYQDCCEIVDINDIVGDLKDLIGVPILEAEEVASENEHPNGVKIPEFPDDSFTWTFYKLTTIDGSVTIRWYGGSNGYYSESVDFCKED